MDNNRDNQISQAGIEGVMLWTHYYYLETTFWQIINVWSPSYVETLFRRNNHVETAFSKCNKTKIITSTTTQ